MKKTFLDTNKIMAVLFLVAVSFTSCQKLINIPVNPPSSLTQQEQYVDSASTMSVVAGVYSYNVSNGFAYSDGALTYSAGLSADELSYDQSDDEGQFYNYSLTPLNNGIISLWGYPYQSIYQVNDVLNNITNNNNLSATFKKQITGEMEVVRALYYFNLVNLFGGVPLVTSTSYTANSRLAKSSVTAVYARIMTDLADARKKLTATYPSAGHIRPNLFTAIALQAKVNLYQGKWKSAYLEADSVISSNMYSVTNTPLSGVFLDGSNEAIWQLPSTGSYNVLSDAAHFVPQYNGATPNYLITPFLLSAFETGDQRLQNWVGTTTVNGNTLYFPYKYKNIDPTVTPVEDQMIFRLGELYLIRAEAAVHLSNLPQAVTDVNVLRARAGLAPSTVDVTSPAAVLDAVVRERRVELFCEWGNRWYDLKRMPGVKNPNTTLANEVLGAEKTGYTANAALYPIPQTQIQLDNLLIQNPGYN